MKSLISIALLALLSGCASNKVVDWNGSSVISAMPSSIKGARFSTFPLDKAKTRKVETSVIEKSLIDTLVANGMVYENNPKQQVPNYFVMYDYASDYGITSQYEHAFVMVVYALESKPRQVFKARLKIDSSNNDTVKNVNAAMSELVAKLSNNSGQGGKQ